MRLKVFILWMLICRVVSGQSGQVNIQRVELMPAQPAPYELRNWREVAIQYDSFVYDISRTGQYLPLSFINPAGHNYPDIETFRLHTYVGTNSPLGNEAINVLPSLVGATLAGANKQDQFGRDWIYMSRDFFNKNNGENIYLNAPGAKSGNDWWYDMMPNVFFYQLYDLHPDLDPEIDLQFITIADRMTEAVRAMGGSEAPWQPAYMNYRAWRFETMEPNANGVAEPEAAGAYAWLLYHAFKTTGEEQYRKAAEWSIEFLDQWPNNPSYELMLPYGTLAAAKMNAELGTNYDVEKMINWSFNRGALRGWGTIVGKWGGYDVSGLVGEANDGGNDYAFQLNGVQQAAALVPMVRYDKRFARAIGKWMLNLTNATRLFFPTFLPDDQQDASAWSSVHDPSHVMGHEAMRQVWQGKSPFATGDAVNGGWAATNLALYGTSSIGYLGCLVNTTNVDRILQLDVLATDFYGDEAYPTFLYYNSYSSPRSVQLQVGATPVDVYDALTETFLQQNATGIVPLNIPAGHAMLITLCPVGGTITYDQNKMLVNGVVVDYRQSKNAFQYSPRIKGLAALPNPVEINATVQVIATAEDQDSEVLTYQWVVSDGSVQGEGNEIEYIAPTQVGAYTIECMVTDPEGNADTVVMTIDVVAEINEAPSILEIVATNKHTTPGGIIGLICVASDPDEDDLDYSWSASSGMLSGDGSEVTWTAPNQEGIYSVSVTISDEGSLTDAGVISLLVHVFDDPEATIIAHYPMTGNAQDVSGNNLHGQANGTPLTSDRFGNPQQAYLFPGGAQNISVANDPLLNVTDAISVAVWAKANELPETESFIVSHGSWQNRWKVSITPDRRIRWTVNTNSAVGDLDALDPMETDKFYHLVVTYGDGLMAMYINGELASFKNLTGQIRTTTVPLLIGQMLPGETAYNFNGIIDDVRLYQGILSPEDVRMRYEDDLTSLSSPRIPDIGHLTIHPNPARDVVRISAEDALGMIYLTDWTGRILRTIDGRALMSYDLILDEFSPGMLLVISENEKGRRMGRIVKQ